MNITYENGLATLPDGTTVDFLAVQAACNCAFQELGDQEYAAAADTMCLITGLVQGPHGEWEPRKEGDITVVSARLMANQSQDKPPTSRPVKVSELEGSALDWAVLYARALKAVSGKPVLARDLASTCLRNGAASASTNWSVCGPLIADEGIELKQFKDGGEWLAKAGQAQADGSTPLTAAMRCFVMKRIGAEISVPEVLL